MQPSGSSSPNITQDKQAKEMNGENNGRNNSQIVSTCSVSSTTLRHQNRPKSCLSPQNNQQQWDIELATEIGQSLMLEIRRMQELLQEKNDSLSILSLEKADAYQKLDELTNQLKQRSIALECVKEDLWNLELEKQELTQQVDQLQQQLQKTMADQSRSLGREEKLTLELECLKQQQLVWKEDMDGSRQDKLDLVVLKKELAVLQQNQAPNIKSTAHLYMVSPGDDDVPDLHGNDQPLHLAPTRILPTASSSSPLVQHVQQQRHQRQRQYDELVIFNTTLQSSLQSANITIQELQHSLDNEQKKRMEMETLWRETQEAAEEETYLSLSTDTAPVSTSFDQQNNLSRYPPSPVEMENSEGYMIDKRYHQHTFLSLSDELSLASGALLSPTCPDVHKSTLWSSEILTTHTNLDDMGPTNASSITIISEPTHTKAPSAEHGDSIIQNNTDTYGSLWSTGSYIYQPSSTLQQQQNNSASVSSNPAFNSSTKHSDSDHRCIRALTRTMIGDWMWKYTRKVIGTKFSEKRHKRFFWLHPYSKTLYWSTQEPGLNGYQYKTKSVTIESFVVENHGGLPCLYIQTSDRDLKIECLDDSSCMDWSNSLKYLLIDSSLGMSSLIGQKPYRKKWQLTTTSILGNSKSLRRYYAKNQSAKHHSQNLPTSDCHIDSSMSSSSLYLSSPHQQFSDLTTGTAITTPHDSTIDDTNANKLACFTKSPQI
ncbi:meiotic cell cortex C-terminal pleckstrin homology-domain-containing protein [Chlamydoabsidia padenii]|nr:meiotic cell cortex C-terminal pleckstrin homology-domain-containing protein [Chlamydoabsidia padenii]